MNANDWDDLRERLEKAERELREMSEEGYIDDRVRRRAKAQGVALALDYMRGYGREVAV